LIFSSSLLGEVVFLIKLTDDGTLTFEGDDTNTLGWRRVFKNLGKRAAKQNNQWWFLPKTDADE